VPPALPTHRIVVFDSVLLGVRGDKFATALVTWHDDYLPERCWKWFQESFSEEHFEAIVCPIDGADSPIANELLQ
jgi:hypothetical protein